MHTRHSVCFSFEFAESDNTGVGGLDTVVFFFFLHLLKVSQKKKMLIAKDIL
jgi:hypothetical protein